MSDSTHSNGENTQPAKKRGRIENLKPWKPGQSGNPGGRPRSKPITELYNQILEDPRVLPLLTANVVNLITSGKSKVAAVLQLKEMAERVEGKVSQPVEHSGEVTLQISERMRKARERKAK